MNRQWNNFREALLVKLNTKAAAMVCAAYLIGAGVYMCDRGLQATGAINLKTVFLEGRLESASLGLFAILLAVVIIGLVLHASATSTKASEEVRIPTPAGDVVCKGLTYGKLQQVLRLTCSDQLEAEDSVGTTPERHRDQAA